MDSKTAWLGIAIGLGMVAVGGSGILLVRWWFGRGRGGWAGAAAWSVAVAAKFAVAAPTLDAVQRWLEAHAGRAATPLFVAWAGALTGVFEVGLVGLLVRRGRLGRADLGEAVRFGAGFGAAEAVTVGLCVAGAAAMAGFAPHVLPAAALRAIAGRLGGASGPADVLWPALERTSALIIHIVSVLLVVAGARTGRFRLGFAVAFVYKSLVDVAAAAVAVGWGPQPSAGQVAFAEWGVAAVAAASLLAARALARALVRAPVSEAVGPEAG